MEATDASKTFARLPDLKEQMMQRWADQQRTAYMQQQQAASTALRMQQQQHAAMMQQNLHRQQHQVDHSSLQRSQMVDRELQQLKHQQMIENYKKMTVEQQQAWMQHVHQQRAHQQQAQQMAAFNQQRMQTDAANNGDSITVRQALTAQMHQQKAAAAAMQQSQQHMDPTMHQHLLQQRLTYEQGMAHMHAQQQQLLTAASPPVPAAPELADAQEEVNKFKQQVEALKDKYESDVEKIYRRAEIDRNMPKFIKVCRELFSGERTYNLENAKIVRTLEEKMDGYVERQSLCTGLIAALEMMVKEETKENGEGLEKQSSSISVVAARPRRDDSSGHRKDRTLISRGKKRTLAMVEAEDEHAQWWFRHTYEIKGENTKGIETDSIVGAPTKVARCAEQPEPLVFTFGQAENSDVIKSSTTTITYRPPTRWHDRLDDNDKSRLL